MGRHDVRLVCFNKAKETTERLERDRQHQDAPLCLPFLCGQRFLQLSLHSTAIFGTKGVLGGSKHPPQGLTIDHDNARRMLDDTEDHQIRLCFLGNHWTVDHHGSIRLDDIEDHHIRPRPLAITGSGWDNEFENAMNR